ncbi:MAG: YIEGIA family protein [Halanaerobiaceae bacterium]
MFAYEGVFLTSLFMGALSRAFMLRIDYRQFPSYPHSYIIHLTMGGIAAALGALALPALLEKEYIAVTFLTLGAQQFREVRSLERDSLVETEATELVPRGAAYIEGIAKLFEARNYVALVTALTTSVAYYFIHWSAGIVTGSVVGYFLHWIMRSKNIVDIATVEVVPMVIDGYNIGVDDVIIMNVGEREALSKWRQEGIGIKITPDDEDARNTLSNLGQRQAILHDLTVLMGVKLDQGMQQFTPLARLQLDEGTLRIIIIPQEPDEKYIKQAVQQIPVLESAEKKPLKSKIGRGAAD